MADTDILNAALDFSSVDPRDRFAFRGMPRQTLFRPGDRLHRFVSLPDARFSGNELFKSPWWQPQGTFNSIVRTANRTGSSIVESARAGLAVSRDWNPTMDWLTIIELSKPAYGWVGAARSQPERGDDRTVLLKGNLDQVYLPNLAAPSDGQSSEYAFVCYYGSMTWV